MSIKVVHAHKCDTLWPLFTATHYLSITVLLPTYYRIIPFAARRTLSTPVMSRLQSHVKDRGSPRSSATSWRSRRACSLDSQDTEKNRTQSPCDKERHKQHPARDIQNGSPAKYAVLQHVRKEENISSFEQEHNLECADPSEANPVAKLKTFLNNIIEKIFDDKESEKTHNHAQETPHAMDNSKEFSAKLSTILSYFSSENREKYFKGEFLTLLAKKLFPSKDELNLNEFNELSADCKETGNELVPRGKGDNGPRMSQSSDVIICMNGKRADARRTEGRVENVKGVSLSVVARLVESLASSSDAESDSSSSSDYLTSESSAAEDCDRVQTALVSRRKKAFQHTTVNCEERPGNVLTKTATAGDSLSSSSSSLVSTSSSLSSSSSSSSPSRKSPKKTKSKLYQRYYHVFCAGELVKLVQDGIPSAVVLRE